LYFSDELQHIFFAENKKIMQEGVLTVERKGTNGIIL